MKILNLLEELEDHIDTAATVPVLGKTVIDKDQVLDILKDINQSLPSEIQEAKGITEEREKIIREAEEEYQRRMNEAQAEHDRLVDNHEITQKAAEKATRMLDDTEAHIKDLKLRTYDYLDKMIYDFQEKMAQLHAMDFTDMFAKFQAAFDTVNDKLENNREQIKDLASKTDIK
jgi:vacuolar-type H+-ATPase subunit H